MSERILILQGPALALGRRWFDFPWHDQAFLRFSHGEFVLTGDEHGISA
jgi:hypothetical protein